MHTSRRITTGVLKNATGSNSTARELSIVEQLRRRVKARDLGHSVDEDPTGGRQCVEDMTSNSTSTKETSKRKRLVCSDRPVLLQIKDLNTM